MAAPAQVDLVKEFMGAPLIVWLIIIAALVGWALVIALFYLFRGPPSVLAVNASKVIGINVMPNSQAEIRPNSHSSLGSDTVRRIGEFVHSRDSTFRAGRFTMQLTHTRFGMTIPQDAAELADVLMRQGVESMPILKFDDLRVVERLVEKKNKGLTIDKDSRDWKRYSRLCDQMWSAKHLRRVIEVFGIKGNEKTKLESAIAKFEDPEKRSSITEDEKFALYQAQLMTLQTQSINVTRLGEFFENKFTAHPAMVQLDRIQEEARKLAAKKDEIMKLFIIGIAGLLGAGVLDAIIMRMT